MRNTRLELSVIALVFTSCSVSYDIAVHRDGSATVDGLLLDSAEMVKYTQSPLVSNIDTTERGIAFDISTIDSLGNYLTPFQPGFMQFHMDSASFTIMEGSGKAFDSPAGRACCSAHMDIHFEQDVKTFTSSNSSAYVADTNFISISRDKGELRRGKDKTNVTVEFGKTDSVPSYVYGKWGGGLDVGAGMYNLTGESQEMISQGHAYYNVGLTVSYMRFHFMLRAGGMVGSLKQGLTYGPEWKAGNRFSSGHPQLAVGYELLCTRHFNIIPYVSGGVVRFSTQTDVDANTWIDTRHSPTYSVGAAFDFKMNSPSKKNRIPGEEYTMDYVYFRLLTGIYPGYFQQSLHVNGAMYFVNLSIGFYVGGRKAK